MKIKRAYFVNKFKITPSQILKNDIFPKYVGKINGLPIIEVDFKDTPENRKILIGSSLVSKLPKGFNSIPALIKKVAEEEGVIQVDETFYNGSPILDSNFLKNLLKAGIRRLQDYRRDGKLNYLYVGAEIIKKIVSYISQSLEVGAQSPSVSLTTPSIYEFNPHEVAENFSNELAETIDLEFQRSENSPADFKPIRYSSLNKVASVIEKYSKIYPFLYEPLAKFANRYSAIFLNPIDPSLGPKNLYYTKLGSIAKVEDTVKTENGIVFKYRLDKKAVYKEVAKELFELVKKAYIRYLNVMPTLKRGKCNYCIVSSKGKPVACYPSEKKASQVLLEKLGTYLPKKATFYVVAYNYTPVLVTPNKDEAIEAYTRLNNFANYLRYLTIHSTYNRDLTFEELGKAIKVGSLFYLADKLYTITAIDDAAKSFVEFSEKVEKLLADSKAPGKATFVVEIPTSDSEVFSVKQSAEFRNTINETLYGFEEVGETGVGNYISYVKSFEFSGGGSKDTEQVRKELEKLVEEYDIDNPGKFPPFMFSYAVKFFE